LTYPSLCYLCYKEIRVSLKIRVTFDQQRLITLTVYSTMDALEAARRAGPSATADTCYSFRVASLAIVTCTALFDVS